MHRAFATCFWWRRNARFMKSLRLRQLLHEEDAAKLFESLEEWSAYLRRHAASRFASLRISSTKPIAVTPSFSGHVSVPP